MRVALAIEYKGTNYHGWQSQDLVTTVQDEIEKALSQVADSPITTICAGRTDAGVHAKGQVVHFDTSIHRDPLSWVRGTNRFLPKDIAIIWAQEVPEDFHARYSAIARRYQYVIYNHPVRSAIWHKQATWHCMPLDIKAMEEGAKHLIGKHDFSAYRAAECQSKTAIREIIHLNIMKNNDLIVIDIKANAFLHHMVRNIIGVLLAIGERKKSTNWSKEVLESRDRSIAGITAKPDGLYFMEVDYSKEFTVPTTNLHR